MSRFRQLSASTLASPFLNTGDKRVTVIRMQPEQPAGPGAHSHFEASPFALGMLLYVRAVPSRTCCQRIATEAQRHSPRFVPFSIRPNTTHVWLAFAAWFCALEGASIHRVHSDGSDQLQQLWLQQQEWKCSLLKVGAILSLSMLL